ncbi:response regulator [Paenibacillus sp. 22594]|uniref:response regulator n=1 Tax=Paenibacillus sp. 22594 TaxID=3453947 RepID=UPI003F85A242
MIVDDEERAGEGIRTLLNWQSLGITIIAEAHDGAQALEQLCKFHVDILITDVRMPQIDGLTLIGKVRDTYPHIKSVIISGYNNFPYIQKAITLGVSDYLLKPSSRQEISDTILNIIAEIEYERRQADDFNRFKRGFRENL